MPNPLARNLLEQHYKKLFQPLGECTFTSRNNSRGGCPDLTVMRMLSRRADGQLMQVLATIGVSEFRLPREDGIPANRNEYVTFVPADWDMDDPKHRWVLDMLADLSDYTAENHVAIYYGHKVDMTDSDALYNADEDVSMAGVVLLAPLNDEREECITCRTGILSRVNIIHMMPVTGGELQQMPSELIRRFYPDSGEARYLCARKR